MDKSTTAHIDAGMTDIGRGVIFKEHQIALLQIAGGCYFRPFTNRGKAGGTIATHANTAGAEAEVDQAGAVESRIRTLFGPGIWFSHHSGCDRDQSIRAIGGGVRDIGTGGGIR